MIVIEEREMLRAFKEFYNLYNETASQESRSLSNATRIQLFYSVECGLKALYLKQKGYSHTASITDKLERWKHNLNLILTEVGAKKDLALKGNEDSVFSLSSIRKDGIERDARLEELNQVWRYGAKLRNPDDKSLEDQLKKIYSWVTQQLDQLK